MKTINIIVSPSGETKVETNGFTGAECREASKFIEQALAKQTDTRTTPEFFRVQATQQQQASNGS